MYELTSTPGASDINDGERDTRRRIEWLKAQLAAEDEATRMRRAARLAAAQSMMLHPVPTREAFALFGTLLGLLPPAAIFYRLFGYGIFAGPRGNRPASEDSLWVFLLCLAMNVVCCLVGRVMGRMMGDVVEGLERDSWGWMVVAPALVGVLWGAATGTAGGAVWFALGAIGGLFFAVPTGAFAFAVFTPFHRMLAHGGMIDVRHLWALLVGVVGSIVSLILSPTLFKY